MSEHEEPDWLAELAKGGEELRRQIEPIVQAAEQFVRDSRRAKTTGGPALPFARRVALAVDAGVRELLPPSERHVVHHSNIIGTAAIVRVVAVPGTVTGSVGLALPPMRVAKQGTVQEPPSGQAERSIGQVLALVLVAIGTWRLLVVPEPDRAAVDHYLTVIGVALTIAVIICNKQNKPK
jgi:hypothetical protein